MAYLTNTIKNVEGTSISIDDSYKLKDLVLEGDTYQYTTTGKNLCNLNNTASSGGITFTKLDNGKLKLTGTSTRELYMNVGVASLKINTDYTLSCPQTQSGVMIPYLNSSVVSGGNWINTTTKKTSFRIGETKNYNVTLNIKNGVTLNTEIELQLEEGTNATSFEPYTNGASPNPDYPQDVHVVTGDNTIKVEGKNLFNSSVERKNAYPHASGGDIGKTLVYDNSSATYSYVKCTYVESNKTYTIKWTQTTTPASVNTRIGVIVDENNIVLQTQHTWYNSSNVLTFTPTYSGYLVLATDINATNIQIEKGSTATTYEPYQGRSYEINLGKNLSSVSKMTTVGGGYINSSTGHLGNVIAGETYTLSFFNNSNYTNYFTARVYYESTYADQQSANLIANGLNTFTFTASNNGYAALSGKVAEDTTDLFTNIQLEKGSVATSYAPYFTPIELCKIGNYQDKIDKSSGKNLINDTFTSSTNLLRLNIENFKAGTYTFSIKMATPAGNQLTARKIVESTTTQINAKYNATELTFTLDEDATLQLEIYKSGLVASDVSEIMLNEGTTATEYEPYGTDWYLKKEIGKVVLNGSESGYAYYVSNENYHQINATFDISNIDTTDKSLLYCSHFEYYSNSTGSNKNQSGMTLYNTSTNFVFSIPNALATSVAEWKTWLSSNNTTVYYVLSTPTYEKITNQELISQLEAVRLLEGVNNITVDSPYLSSILSLDYYSTENPYQDAIYSQDDSNDLKIYFNDVELEDAGRYCEKITRIARILPNDGGKRFSLDNFISTSVEVILHNVDIEDIVDQVRIEIGTDIGNNTFQYVPLGVFNIQDTPEKDGNKITLKLRDNRVKFDFNYNAYPLIQSLGGSATKKQILDDICEQAGVECLIDSFNGDSDLIGIYDSTISATTYVSYLMEQAGLIPVIDRYGRLIAIDLSQLDKWRIPLSIVESYEKGSPYGIERVVYESGTLKYETSDDDTLDTLYLNSANPYVSSNSQVSYILNKLQDFNIDSVTTKRVLGNPAIDPYDIIEVYNDLDGSNDIVFRTLGNTTYTFNGVHRDVFDTQIGKEERTENVTIRGLPAFQKYAKVEIDNMNATITQTVTSVEELQESIDLFSVDLSQYNVVVATDSDRKPYTTETVAVNYYGYYKGQQVTPTVAITGSESNVTVTTSNTAINFKVTQGNAVANKSYTYTATFTYNDAGTTYTVAKKIVLSLSIEGKAGQDGQDGQDGRDGTDGTSAYFYVRYSANADGSNMTAAPQSDTKYMGVASTTSSTPPTQPSGYVWSEIRGEDGQDGQQGIPGQPGADGTSSYLHIKWSDDGTTFTPAQGSTPAGKTPGRWQGTYVDTNQTDSTTFSDYNWVDTGIYVQDELNSLETSIGAVDARVTDTNTNIANNYYNKDQVDALSEANANNIATVTQRVVTLEQKSDSYAININKILTNGVSSVTTATGYVFNENGLNISKTGSEIANLLDNTGMFVRRNNTEMLGADSTGVRAENLLVRKYLIMGTNSRFEDYESNRTACFYIGGSN